MANTETPPPVTPLPPSDTLPSLKAMMKKKTKSTQTNGTYRSGSRPAYGPTATQADLLASYSLPDDKLKRTLDDSTKTPLVLIACGSFNPETLLHLRMFEMAADFVRRNTEFELVGQYMSPVGDAYRKPGLAAAAHRITMCNLGVRGSDRIMVDPWEAYHSEYKPTAQVLKHFDNEINVVRGGIMTKEGEVRRCRLALLAGADLMGTMSTPGVWSDDDIEIILGQYGVYVIERSGTDIEEALQKLDKWRDNIIVIEQLVKNDVSSTIIRNFLRKDLSVRYLIPADVLDYIDEHGLYNEDGIRPHSRSRSAEKNGGGSPK